MLAVIRAQFIAHSVKFIAHSVKLCKILGICTFIEELQLSLLKAVQLTLGMFVLTHLEPEK